jgi:hypothetical protein
MTWGATEENPFLGKKFADPTIKKSRSLLSNLNLKKRCPPLANNVRKRSGHFECPLSLL